MLYEGGIGITLCCERAEVSAGLSVDKTGVDPSACTHRLRVGHASVVPVGRLEGGQERVHVHVGEFVGLVGRSHNLEVCHRASVRHIPPPTRRAKRV